MARPLYLDLLHTARQLVRMDRRRPRRSNLRRAVSSAYYALFHFLIDKSSRHLVGGTTERRPRRHLLARAYGHGEMLAVCRAFETGNFPPLVSRLAPVGTIPTALKELAQRFRETQGQRHLADYDLAVRFARDDVLDLINGVERSFHDWPAIRDDPAVRLFLVNLLVWDRVRGK